MNIKRIQKSNNYSIISNKILRRKDLSLKAKGLMSLILSLPDTWDLTVNGLVEIVKESKNTIYSILKELNAKGYVERERIRDKAGKVVKWELYIYECPHTKKPEVDNPDVDNRTQINKDNKINTNSIKITWIEEVESSDYSNNLKQDFIEYWSEESKSGKTRQSMQKTWNTARRLKTWSKNEIVWNKKSSRSKIENQISAHYGALELLEKKYEGTN